tara:strand:- start:379 stop:6360 length:5982 start_codon:yes stop_codon:yes gene_type:complete
MQLPGRPNFAIGQQGVNVYKPQDQSINDVHPYLRTNYAQEQFTQPGSGLNSTASTTGMSCMLCQHALVMSFKRSSYKTNSYGELRCGEPGASDNGCPIAGPVVYSFCDRAVIYNWYDSVTPEEEEMSALYLHWKDYWYLERLPTGVPFTWWDEGRPTSGNPNPASSGSERLGYRPGGIRINDNACQRIIPRATDANYMCYPELKVTTNALNPYFERMDGSGRDPEGGGLSGYQTHLESAYHGHCKDYGNIERTRPEFDNIESGLVSNGSSITYEGYSCPGSGIGGPDDTGPGGVGSRGFSSWQCFMMQENSELRTLADVVSFADGRKLFNAPSPTGSYGDLYSTMIGTLYRVRLWVRADKIGMNTEPDTNDEGRVFTYPCVAGNLAGGVVPDGDGTCCVPFGPCVDSVGREDCEQKYYGTYYDRSLCSGNNWMSNKQCCECREAYGPSDGCTESSADDRGIVTRYYTGDYDCRAKNVITVGCGERCVYDSTDKPKIPADSYGNVTAFHPPIVNKMLHQSTETGGFSKCKKQHAGPWGMLYTCAGVPVFSYELDQMVEDGVLSSGDAGILKNYWKEGAAPTEECTEVGPAVERLGDTGRFNAKDWREDQVSKLSTLETEFRRLAQTYSSEVDDSLLEYEIPDEIKRSVQANELLPVQKTGESMLLAYINQAYGKEQVRRGGSYQQYKLSGEMSDYQVSDHSSTDFAINKYDPWHPNYIDKPTDQEVEIFKGFNNRPSIPLTFSWGTFEFKYPIQEIYDSYFGEGVYEISEWEKAFFKVWYENIPIYFHSTPGGWAWTGTGLGPAYRVSSTPATTGCGWDDNSLGVLDLTDLTTFYQLDINTKTGQGCHDNPQTVNEYSTQCCAGCVEDDASGGGGGDPGGGGGGIGLLGGGGTEYDHRGVIGSCPPMDPFPNNVRVGINTEQSTELFPQLDLQPRIAVARKTCKTLPTPCLGCEGKGRDLVCEDDGPEGGCPGGDCCRQYSDCKVLGPGTRSGTGCGGGHPCDVPSSKGIACCRDFQPYGNPGLGIARGGFRRTADNADTSNNKNSTLYKNQQGTNGICASIGQPCSPGGPPGPGGFVGGGGCVGDCECCCSDGCGGDCVCTNPGECTDFGSLPCEPPNYTGNCCDFDGVCCIKTDNPPTCIDTVSQEWCTANSGVWHPNETCSKDVCGDDGPLGSCCPVCAHNDVSCIENVTEAQCYKLWQVKHDQECCDDDCCDPDDVFDFPCPECCGAIWTEDTPCPDPPNPFPPDGGDIDIGCLVNPWFCCNTIGSDDVEYGGCEIRDFNSCLAGGGEPIAPANPDFDGEAICEQCKIGRCCTTNTTTGVVTCNENITFYRCNQFASDEISVTFDEGAQFLCSDEGACGSDGGGGGGGGGGNCCDGTVSCGPDQVCNDTSCTCNTPPDPLCITIGFQSGCQDPGNLFGHIATRWRPRPEQVETQLKEECSMNLHDVLDSCVRRHYQASKTAFRITTFVTMSDPDPYAGESCPGAVGGGVSPYVAADACCCPGCAQFHNRVPGAMNACTGSLEGLTTRTIHSRKQEFTVTVYPFRLRCAQVRDINGYQRCGLLTDELEITNEAYVARLPRLLTGAVDPLSCNYSWKSDNGVVSTRQQTCQSQDRCATPGEFGEDGVSCCIFESEETTTVYGIPESGDQGVRPIRNQNLINAAGYCQDLTRTELFAAHSLIPPGLDPVEASGIYTPAPVDGQVRGIPNWSCPRSRLNSTTELERPGKIPEDTVLRTCAEFFNDKELSKINTPVTTENEANSVVFRGYGGVQDPEITGVSAEYVDIDVSDVGWKNFWMNQDHTGIEGVRLFSVGDFNIEGGFGGGMSESRTDIAGVTRGLFAGTMVVLFDTETNFRYFDTQIGNQNIKMTVGPDGIPGQPAEANMAGCEFIGRPMRNPFWTEANPPDTIGWIDGRGLTYANVRDGSNRPQVGKVYEFCSDVDPFNEGECALKPVSGGVVGPGQRGPVGLASTDPFTIYIDRMGISNGNFIGCD